MYDVYESFSRAKENAYDYCLSKCHSQGGTCFAIIGHNSMMFSVGWEYTKNGKKYFHYETNKSSEDWRIDE